jgi:hypothetical protein
MQLSPRKINWFLLFKLPAAFFCGVRLRTINERECTTSVTHRWINQNPFKSMFWAVQGMAAELSTGALVMAYIKEYEKPVSMLVARNSAAFSKKARGRITFQCNDGPLIKNAIERTIATGEGQICEMRSQGKDRDGDVVSEFKFEWTVKLRS